MDAELRGIRASLIRLELCEPGEQPEFERLTGGVSSDIWKVVRRSGEPICVKRALPRLRVAAEWTAPLERNLYEARWMRRAAAIAPGAVPRLLGHDAEAAVLAMAYLPPGKNPLWKAELSRGGVDPAFASGVGDRLGRIHAGTAHDPDVAAEFPTDGIFHAIRLEPYLMATGRAHPNLAPIFDRLASETAATRHVLVHGDVSPKNILIGAAGPVFLDAECAWYGDPAFDLAFCLNHLMLKCMLVPEATATLLRSFDLLAAAYLSRVTWEPREAVETRAARLLPALMLARVDGKSPVEYLTRLEDKDLIRRFAAACLVTPVGELTALRTRWADALRHHP